MNRLGVYDVDAAFDKMSLQTAEEFGLDAILEQLVRAADVEGVRRLIEVSTPEGYRVPAACLRAAQQTAYAFDDTGFLDPVEGITDALARGPCYSDPMVSYSSPEKRCKASTVCLLPCPRRWTIRTQAWGCCPRPERSFTAARGRVSSGC